MALNLETALAAYRAEPNHHNLAALLDLTSRGPDFDHVSIKFPHDHARRHAPRQQSRFKRVWG
jgi:hypothetical protein